MSSLPPTPDRLAQAIQSAVREEVEKISQEEADAAAERTRQRVKAKLAEISLGLVGDYDVQRQGMNIMIMVRDRDPRIAP